MAAERLGRGILVARLEQQVMRAAQHQIGPIGRSAFIMVQRKDRTGRDDRGIGGTLGPGIIRSIALQLFSGLRLTLFGDLVMPGRAVTFDRIVGMAARALHRLHLQIGIGQRHVIVEKSDFSGDHLTILGPFKDRVGLGLLFTDPVAHGKIHRAAIGMGADAVAQDDLFHRAGMVEIIIDAVLFHEAADEGKVALAVLHAIFARLVSVRSLVGHIGKAGNLKDLFDNFDGGHALKDPIFRPDGHQPRPRPDLGGKQIATVLTFQFFNRNDDSGKLEFVFRFQCDRGPQNIPRVKGRILGKELHPHFRDGAQPVADAGADANQPGCPRTA